MEIYAKTLFQLLTVLSIFLVLTLLGGFIYRKLKNRYGNSLNPTDFLPEDEIHTLRQVFYLILLASCVINIFYGFTAADIGESYNWAMFDIILSLYFAIKLDNLSKKNILLWALLVPYGSLSYPIFGLNFIIFIDFIHILVFTYFAKVNFDKFMKYTNSNGLGVTILLLFAIIFASFFITQYSEGVNALDSLVIVSNQFTGNGYSVFGESASGKIDSLFLVWGGYIISGVFAATLTAAILTRHFKKEFEELRELIEEDEHNEN